MIETTAGGGDVPSAQTVGRQTPSAHDGGPTERARLRPVAQSMARYAEPDLKRSLLQLTGTALPLAAFWAATSISVTHGVYWAGALLALPAAVFLVRLFMIQHDCGHHSYFRSPRLNDLFGHAIGVLTLTPHGYWRRAHNIHHSTNGNLDGRGIGDIGTLTVREYLSLPRWKRVAYRIYRHPVFFLGVGPLYVFVVKWRLPLDLLRQRRGALASVLATNLAIAALVVAAGLWLGFLHLLMIHGPIILVSSFVGVWLFYIQHQFERTQWWRREGWDFFEAALHGSSFLDLPRPLRWMTANIGLHHIHHLSSRIPNYRLYECLNDNPELRDIGRITLLETLKCFSLALWDEDSGRLVSFGIARRAASLAEPG